jgi:hypothetical protein
MNIDILIYFICFIGSGEKPMSEKKTCGCGCSGKTGKKSSEEKDKTTSTGQTCCG